MAAFLYGHDVPLGVAHRLYTICNPHKQYHYLVPYAMGGYYAYFHNHHNAIHMAQYYDVRRGEMLWVNGRDHLQLEPVLPDDMLTPPLDCSPLRHSHMAEYAELAHSTMSSLCNVPAFDIMHI